MHLNLIRLGEILERRASSATSLVSGLSFSETRLLTPLLNAGSRGLSRGELAELSHLTASAVSRALKPLEKTRYILTAPDARDGRQARAILTPAGRERLEHALSAVGDLWNSLDFEKQGLKPQTVEQILAHLQPGLRPAAALPPDAMRPMPAIADPQEPEEERPNPKPLSGTIPRRPGIRIT